MAIFANPNLDGQSILSYNGVVLQIVRTEEWVCEPDLDYAGIDYCLNHIILGVRAIVNPSAVAVTNFAGGANSRAGVTLAELALQQNLMAPRQSLVYMIGPDVVISTPRAGAACDAKNGPKPLALRILEVKGTKTAVIYFRIETWTGGKSAGLSGENIVLSNRWSVQAHVDEDWKTTITTRGRMRVRTDGMQTQTPPSPDIFRRSVLPLPVPDTMKRDEVNVVAKEDGTELMWECIDRQKDLNLTNAAALGVTRVEGHYTTGSQVDFKDMKDLVNMLFSDPAGLVWSLVPNVRSSFYVKVTGPPPGTYAAGAFKNGIRGALLDVALQVALDRFRPSLPKGFNFAGGTVAGVTAGAFTGGLVSLYATVSIENCAVELRGDVLGTLAQAENPGNFWARFTTADDITGFPSPASPMGPLIFLGRTGNNPDPPRANTSRGSIVGALLEQVLKGQYALPAANRPSVTTVGVGIPFK